MYSTEKVYASRQWTHVSHEGKNRTNKVILVVTARISALGNQSPAFHVTYEESDNYSRRRDDLRAGGSGDYDTMIRPIKHLKDTAHLAHCLQYHGYHTDRAAWYYIENSVYFWEIAIGERDAPKYSRSEPVDAFYHTIGYGLVDSDKRFNPLKMSRTTLLLWLAWRKPALMRRFYADMAALFPGLTFKNGLPVLDYSTEPTPQTALEDDDSLPALLARAGITMTAERTFENPAMPDNTDMTHWKLHWARGKKRMSSFFSMGSGYKGRQPTPAEAMSSLLMDAESADSTLEDFTREYGYDDESDARRTWAHIRKNTRFLKTFLGDSLYSDLMAFDL